jgi:hypothetical protein
MTFAIKCVFNDHVVDGARIRVHEADELPWCFYREETVHILCAAKALVFPRMLRVPRLKLKNTIIRILD